MSNDLSPEEISAEELLELISDAECGDPTPWSQSQEQLILRALRQLRASIHKLGDYNETVFQLSEIDKSQSFRIRQLERELSEVHEANAIVTRERNDAVAALRAASETGNVLHADCKCPDCGGDHVCDIPRVGPTWPDNDMVICPQCTSQFVAVPVNVQAQLRAVVPPTAIPDDISNVAELLHTQDNRITDQPIFLVQKKHRIWGMDDGYEDGWAWVGEESEITDPEEIKRLNALDDSGSDLPKNVRRIGYKDQWKFVTACFTEAGCERFIKRDGHNHGETRIYAAGSYRNYEWQNVRKFLMSLRAAVEPGDSNRE